MIQDEQDLRQRLAHIDMAEKRANAARNLRNQWEHRMFEPKNLGLSVSEVDKDNFITERVRMNNDEGRLFMEFLRTLESKMKADVDEMRTALDNFIGGRNE